MARKEGRKTKAESETAHFRDSKTFISKAATALLTPEHADLFGLHAAKPLGRDLLAAGGLPGTEVQHRQSPPPCGTRPEDSGVLRLQHRAPADRPGFYQPAITPPSLSGADSLALAVRPAG